MNYLKIFLIAAFSFSSFSCAQHSEDDSVTMDQFIEKLENNKDIIVLDVRTPEEVAAGMIDNAINIPVQVLEQRVKELDKYKEKEIYVICRTQNRSAYAQDILESKGFKAKYVQGGMTVYNQK
ncbi:MAG: rhodanese-like domain-containing protein [Ignavibacterium sp.]|jgi:rhodanese-related sulfurtransferase|nr:rhodanese-like domain-containing protein [Ignavibacterium sp.]